MGIDNPIESNADDLISAAYDVVFKEEEIDEVENSVKEEEIDEVENTDEIEEVEDESTEEVEDEKEIDEKESNITDTLKNVFSKDYIKLLESIDNPDLRNKFIEEGKKNRSELDRKRERLGESGKLVDTLDEVIKATNLPYNKAQYADYVKNLVSFDALFTRDPKLALESLAKTANLDLNTLGKKPVQDDDYEDYRTPEEIKRDQEIETLKHELNLIKNQKQQEERLSVQQEVNNFANAKDSNGELKYPHFEKVRKDMAIFYPDRTQSLDEAYQRALRLNDELFEEEKKRIEKGAESKRKEQVEKAKKLKRQSVNSSRVSAQSYNPDVALEKIVGSFFS